MHTPNHAELDRCITACSHCAAECTRTSIHCLDMGGEHAAPEHQTLLLDCADICATAVRFMARNSPHHPHVCRECAEICIQCAEECEQMRGADDQMKKCAEACRQCAHTCQQMAGARV